MLLPLNPNLTVFYWWIGQSLQVRPIPLPDSPSHRLPSGMSGGGARYLASGHSVGPLEGSDPGLSSLNTCPEHRLGGTSEKPLDSSVKDMEQS